MTLKKISEFLDKLMIGVFISIIPLALIAMIFPIFGFVVFGLIFLLLIVTALDFILACYLFAKEMSELMSMLINLYKSEKHEQGQ